jgi:hypothetical protein
MDQRRYRRYPSPTIQHTATCLKDLVGCRRVYWADCLYNFPLSQATEDTMCSYALTGPPMAVFLACHRSSCVSSVLFADLLNVHCPENRAGCRENSRAAHRDGKFPNNSGKWFTLSPDSWELRLQVICFSTRWDFCCPVFGKSACTWNVHDQRATDVVIMSETYVKVSYPAQNYTPLCSSPRIKIRIWNAGG